MQTTMNDLENEFELCYESEQSKNLFAGFINRLLNNCFINNIELDIRTLLPYDAYITKKYIKKLLDWHNEELSAHTRIIYISLYDIPMV